MRTAALADRGWSFLCTCLVLLVVASAANDCTSLKQFVESNNIGSILQWKTHLPDWCCNQTNPAAGVLCSEGRVVQLNLSSLGASGQLSGAFTELTALQIFNISKNIGIAGNLPPSVDRLQNLQILAVDETSLYGTIPVSLFELPNIRFFSASNSLLSLRTLPARSSVQEFHMSSCFLEGTIPDLRNWPLKRLGLSNNHLKDFIPTWLGTLQLETLWLQKNALMGTIPPNLLTSRTIALDLSQNLLTGTLPELPVATTQIQLLNFGHNKLSGSIPPSLYSNGRSLRVLNLTENLLAGSVTQIDQLSLLEVLDLSFNHFTGRLPDLTAPGLRHVKLNANEFVGAINPAVGRLEYLTTLHLADNKITGTIPQNFLHANIRFMSLASNYLTGKIPSGIGRLVQLETLALGDNSLEASVPDDFAMLVRLQTLDLSTCGLSGTFPALVSQFPNLTFLSLASNYLYGTIPDTLYNLSHLQVLRIDRNILQGTLSPLIGKMKALVEVTLFKQRITGTLPVSITNLTNLESLDVSNAHFEGTVPPLRLPNLRYLDLSQNGFAGPLPSLFEFPKLRYLRLFRNSFSGTLPEPFAYPNLQRINLGDNKFSGPIKGLNSANLEWAKFGNNLFTGSLPSNYSRLSKLKFLDLANNRLQGAPTVLLNTSLVVVNISSNALIGTLPSFEHQGLLLLDIRGNRLACPYPSFTSRVLILTTHCHSDETLYLIILSCVGTIWMITALLSWNSTRKNPPTFAPPVYLGLVSLYIGLNVISMLLSVYFSRSMQTYMVNKVHNCTLVNQRAFFDPVFNLPAQASCQNFAACLQDWRPMIGTDFWNNLNENIRVFSNLCESFPTCKFVPQTYQCQASGALPFDSERALVTLGNFVLLGKEGFKAVLVLVSLVYRVPKYTHQIVSSSVLFPILLVFRRKYVMKEIVTRKQSKLEHVVSILVFDVLLQALVQLFVVAVFLYKVEDQPLPAIGYASIFWTITALTVAGIRLVAVTVMKRPQSRSKQLTIINGPDNQNAMSNSEGFPADNNDDDDDGDEHHLLEPNPNNFNNNSSNNNNNNTSYQQKNNDDQNLYDDDNQEDSPLENAVPYSVFPGK